jgi:hypothetical protein
LVRHAKLKLFNDTPKTASSKVENLLIERQTLYNQIYPNTHISVATAIADVFREKKCD